MSGESIYMIIYNDIVKKIRSRVWTENEPLPAERTLCHMYHVSRTTVRRALERLERDSFIIKKHGNGNFVKPQVFSQPLSHFYSFTDTLKKDGIILRNKIVHYSVCDANANLAKIVGCIIGDPLHKLIRLRSARDCPLMLETTWLPKNRFVHLDIDWLQDNSLYDYLKKNYNMRVTRSTEVFFPVMPNQKERLLLNMPPNLPCMAVERFNYEEDTLVEYTTSIVRGDKYKFEADWAISD